MCGPRKFRCKFEVKREKQSAQSAQSARGLANQGAIKDVVHAMLAANWSPCRLPAATNV